jgi:hypothetical protein
MQWDASAAYRDCTANPRGPACGRNLALGNWDGIELANGRFGVAIRATRATPSMPATAGADSTIGLDIGSGTGFNVTASSAMGGATSTIENAGLLIAGSLSNARPPGTAGTGNIGNPGLVRSRRELRRLTRSTKAMRRGPPTTAIIVVICTLTSSPPI